ncbi:MAG: hypothetical protein CL927_01970 [Deltaproteobacteria bacterium]|nr:hypothetical protein [Deltaproteobacteria bacterium]HCH64226.1 hypothetical protein [Deltaproteobacteria bacterium]
MNRLALFFSLGLWTTACGEEHATDEATAPQRASVTDRADEQKSATLSLSVATTSKGSTPHVHTGVSDTDEDLLDVYMAFESERLVRVHRATGDSTFDDPIEVRMKHGPSLVFSGDFDGDGFTDFMAYAPDSASIIIYENDASGGYDRVDTLRVTEAVTQGAMWDFDLDGRDSVRFSTESDDIAFEIGQAVDGDYELVEFMTSDGGLDTEDTVLDECGDEPDCAEDPTNSGIQECLRAVDCRRDKCYWAACILYSDSLWDLPRYTGAMTACATVALAERLACIPAPLLKGGSTSTKTLSKGR